MSSTKAATPTGATDPCATANPVAAAYTTHHGAIDQPDPIRTDGNQTAATASINKRKGVAMAKMRYAAMSKGATTDRVLPFYGSIQRAHRESPRSAPQTATGALIGA